jgi:RNase P subunit RPR2
LAGALFAGCGDDQRALRDSIATPLSLPNGLAPIAHPEAKSAATCSSCHREIVDEWRSSFHRRSWTNPWFQSAYATEPRDFCRGCHAPLGGGEEPRELAAEEGVACAVCHTNAHGKAPDPRLPTSELCAGCHEFRFQSHADGEAIAPLMQSTVSEAKGSSCRACHMPLVNGHRSHRFDGSSKEMLARSLRVSVDSKRCGEEIELTFTLSARAGHAVPTGDLFRRLEIEARSGERRKVVTLSRLFRTVPGHDDEGNTGYIRRDLRDLRVLPGAPRVVHLRIVAPPFAEITWSIAHVRALAETDSELPGSRTIFLEGRTKEP